MNEYFVSVIVATKDRPEDLSRMLTSLSLQTRKPDQVVVVDASIDPVEVVAKGFPELNLVYERHWPPSASAQRNAGILLCAPEAAFVGFMDDDTTFEADAFEKMMEFWRNAREDLLGASFNLLNYEMPAGQSLKRSKLTNWLGLYSSTPGGVAQSGWQSIFGRVSDTCHVDWLPSGAVLWRSNVLQTARFDEFYTGYSYLEDLDFSFGVSRKGKLAVVAEAGYCHFPSPHGRASLRNFGRVEVRNRVHFVRKHGLSTLRCYVCVLGRFVMTLLQCLNSPGCGNLGRALGNLEGLVSAKTHGTVKLQVSHSE
jgi:glycosyltransferase involved in cell wall biosynthesis